MPLAVEREEDANTSDPKLLQIPDRTSPDGVHQGSAQGRPLAPENNQRCHHSAVRTWCQCGEP